MYSYVAEWSEPGPAGISVPERALKNQVGAVRTGRLAMTGFLDMFWLKDESPSDSDGLPAPAVIAREIVADLEAALDRCRPIGADLGE